ncbi:MAG: hypothetical protein ACE5DI_03930, partial [Candidatus Micrarchaeia archaeon]
NSKHGQAAIFDGITFLLLAAFSVSMLYVFLTDYGASQDKTIRNAHSLNYMENAFKAIYYVDADTLKEETNPPDVCFELSNWKGVSITDVLKKDLRDGKLDNFYGASRTPGLNAMRCATEKLLKTYTNAGYSYFVEVRFQTGSTPGGKLVSASGKGNKNIASDQRIKNCNQNLPADKFVISTPFRVFRCDDNNCLVDDYTLRACLWATQEIPSP